SLRRGLAALAAPPVAVPVIVAGVALVELAIADRKYGVFTGGFGQANAVDGRPELALVARGYGASLAAVAPVARAICARLNLGRGRAGSRPGDRLRPRRLWPVRPSVRRPPVRRGAPPPRPRRSWQPHRRGRLCRRSRPDSGAAAAAVHAGSGQRPQRDRRGDG